jgi:uncharacterized protein YaaN involved in tellurite resistance
VLENGLALKVAQQDEAEIARALEATQDYLGQLMKDVAEESMDNAERVAEVANRPLARLKDLVSAYDVLMTRMDDAARIETRMMESAKENIAQLDRMTRELETRSGAQESGRQAAAELE